MFKNVKKISTKLLIVFIVVAIVSSISGILGVFMLISSDSSYSDALKNYGFVQGDLGMYGMILNENRAMVRDIVYESDEQIVKTAYSKLQQNIPRTTELIDKVRPSIQSPEGIEMFNKVESDLAIYAPLRDQVIELAMQGDKQGAKDIWVKDASPLAEDIAANAEALLNRFTQLGNNKSTELSAQMQMILMIMLIVIGVGFVVSIIIALIMAKSVATPVIAVEQAAQKLLDGNLDIDIRSDQLDEIGVMTNKFADAAKMMRSEIKDMIRGLSEMANGNFNIAPEVEYVGEFKKIESAMANIITSLSNVLRQINQSADQVSLGANQVSAGAQALAQGTTEQASSIEELSATISEVAVQVKQNAENSTNAKDRSGLAKDAVMKSNDQMGVMLGAMNEINDKSAEIAKIVKTIEDIAFQTNILALNAAVEAARAGEAGKGFAVVADEVRNLAEKSAVAAKNTTKLIDETVSAVERGTKIADGTAKALESVINYTDETTDLIVQISDASGEQSMAIAQITTGADQISSVVQTNSATAEESAAASEELSGQASLLKQLVQRFELLSEDSPMMVDQNVKAYAPNDSYSEREYIESGADSKY